MAHKPRHIKYAPTFAVVDHIIEGEWSFVNDGDWRATNERLGLRTRLKSNKQAADEDIKLGRLQKRISGQWVDRIR